MDGVREGFDVVRKVRDLGVTVTSDFKWPDRFLEAARTARSELSRLKLVLSCRSVDVFLPLYPAVVRPHLDYCVQTWYPYFKKDIMALQKVQRLDTRMIAGMKGESYEENLRALKLYSLKRRLLRGDLIETFKIMRGFSGINPQELFKLAPKLGTRGHFLKLAKPHCNLDLRKRFFSDRVVDHWNRLPEELILQPSIEGCKKALDAI